MIYFSIVFLCTAGLFLYLLERRFAPLVTLGAAAALAVAAYLLSLPLRGAGDPAPGRQAAAVGAGCALFFLASLALWRNNPLQKFFLALLAFVSAGFLELFLPLFLGALPVKTAGGLGGFLSAALTVLFYLLLGLCLHRPLRHFRERGPSGFLLGMCLLLACIEMVCLGQADFLFRGNAPAQRLLLSALLFVLVIFCCRSVYQAGHYRQRAARREVNERLIRAEREHIDDLLVTAREARNAQRGGEYALETVRVLVSEGNTEALPAYLENAAQNRGNSPLLQEYHEDPALNAVIAAHAAYAAQNGVDFSCSVALAELPMDPGELCLMVDELLRRAGREAAGSGVSPAKLNFTLFSAKGALRLELLYSSAFQPTQRGPAALADRLLRGGEERDHLHGLEQTKDLISRRGGNLSLSSGGKGEAILQVALKL